MKNKEIQKLNDEWFKLMNKQLEYLKKKIVNEIKSKLLTKGRRPNRTYIKEVLDGFLK